MIDINFDDFKVRCSAIDKVLSNSAANPVITEKQKQELDELEKKTSLTDKQKERVAELLVKVENGKKVILSDTCIDYLMDVYAWKTERMIPVTKESLDIMQMKKGKLAENDSIKLLSLHKGIMYFKNDEQVSNDYLTGEPDVYSGDEIMAAEVVEDTKTIWDYPTYLKMLHKPTEKGYIRQIKGYGDITGAKQLFISKCLVDAPYEIIEEMKWKVAKKFNALTVESPDFLLEWEKWERSMKFSHIAIHKRVNSRQVEPFTEFERQELYDRVKVCREWLNDFHETYQKI